MPSFNPVEVEFAFPKIPPNVDIRMHEFLLQLRNMLNRKFLSFSDLFVKDSESIRYGGDTIATLLISHSIRRAQVVSVQENRYLCKLVAGDVLADSRDSHITLISTASDLNAVRNNMSGRYKLTNDIDLSDETGVGGDYWNDGLGWEPIGDDSAPFTGFFDGDGHTVGGMFIDRADESYVGLFGYVSADATIRDVTIHDADVTGLNNVGSLVGQSFGYIYNCHATGTNTITGTDAADADDIGGLIGDNDGVVVACSSAGVVDGHYDVGGLCGDNDNIIAFSWSTADVDGGKAGDIGGLVGDNKGFKVGVPLSDRPNRGTVFACYATGAVSSSAKVATTPAGDIGGLVGDNKGGVIANSWSTGTVAGYQPQLGGLCGDSKDGDNGLGEVRKSYISNCYTTGHVTALGDLPSSGAIGGLVGDIDEAQVLNSYCSNLVDCDTGYERQNKGDFAGDADDALAIGCFYNSTIGLIGSSPIGTGKTTAELKQEATFIGWDFTSVWSIVEDVSYPTLAVPSASEDKDDDLIDVYPIVYDGTGYLSSAVIPKVKPGQFLLVVNAEDDKYYTPVVVHDLGDALNYNSDNKLGVLVNNNHIGINTNNQLKIIDDSIGKSKLGDDNGDSILGDRLSWDATNKIQVTNKVVESVDVTNVTSDSTEHADNDWHTALNKAVSAEVGADLDIRIYVPIKCVEVPPYSDKRGKFDARVMIGTPEYDGDVIVGARYELPDHADQFGLNISVLAPDISAADPTIRLTLKNDDYTINRVIVQGTVHTGQFGVMVIA